MEAETSTLKGTQIFQPGIEEIVIREVEHIMKVPLKKPEGSLSSYEPPGLEIADRPNFKKARTASCASRWLRQLCRDIVLE